MMVQVLAMVQKPRRLVVLFAKLCSFCKFQCHILTHMHICKNFLQGRNADSHNQSKAANVTFGVRAEEHR